jgi:hypothetical protein
MHYLTHLAQSCYNFGSIRHFSAIPYEDLNGVLLDMNNANFSVEEALMENFTFASNVNAMVRSMRGVQNEPIKPDSPYGKLLTTCGFNWNRMDTELKSGWSLHRLSDLRTLFIKHSEFESIENDDTIAHLVETHQMNQSKTKKFKRIRIDKHHLRSQNANSLHWNSSACLYKSSGFLCFGIISTFLMHDDKYYAFIERKAAVQ